MQIDVDNLIAVFTYCILKSGCKKIIVHKKIIEEFTNSNLLEFGEGAFLFNNFYAACEFILKMGQDKKEGKEQVYEILTSAHTASKFYNLEKMDYWMEKGVDIHDDKKGIEEKNDEIV